MFKHGGKGKRGERLAIGLLLVSALFLSAQQRRGGFQRPAYNGTPPAAQNPPQRPGSGYGNQNRNGLPQYSRNPQTPEGAGLNPNDQVRVGTPPGHLADWLSQHRDLPPEQQEQILRRDPYFNHLNPVEQRRVINQLYRMDGMNAKQRARRIARAEAIERLSPQERMQVNASMQRMQLLPIPRRQLVRQAFRDLRAVPPGQRDSMLNSNYYRSAYTPDERLILHDLLTVEPYEPAP